MRSLILILVLSCSCRGAEVVEIPLTSIVASMRQPSLMSLTESLQTPGMLHGQELRVLPERFNNVATGASDVFLVEATGLHEAVAASQEVLLGGRGVKTPVILKNFRERPKHYWCVVYLGIGPSTPVKWTLKTVSHSNDRVVVQYLSALPGPATEDRQPYLYWIPLGRLRQASMRLELQEQATGATDLMRLVELTP